MYIHSPALGGNNHNFNFNIMTPDQFLKKEILKRIPDIDRFCKLHNIPRQVFDKKIDTLTEDAMFRKMIAKKANCVVLVDITYDVKDL